MRIAITFRDRMLYHASVGITTNMKVQATKWIAENADSMGVHSIWIGEDIGIGQDPFILSAASLMHTQKTRVGTGIVPISVHNITTLARAALSLQEIGSGRFVFGTGIGGIQDLKKLGIELKKPVTLLRQTVKCLRSLWEGRKITVKNELFELDEYELRTADTRIPVFLGVRGPQMLKLVGEEADGAILSGPIEYLRYAVKEINEAALKSGRKSNDVEKIAWLPTIPTFKGGKEKLAKKVVAIVVADMPVSIIDMLAVDKERIDKIREVVASEGPDVGANLIDDDIMDTFAIAGTLTHMVDMFEQVASVGITEVVLGPPFSGDWRGAMQDIFNEIQIRRTQM
ncbi:MAG: LLM class flavin-dependent oxidoreductase [Candidatus Thorarchaeota archaeon]